jgi:cytochrome P450
LLQSFHWLKHIPLFNRFGYDEFKKQNGDFHKVIRDELKNHKQDIEMNEEPNDFAAAYLQEIKRRGDEPSSYSEWQLISIMLDLWVAGMDTTITTMMWGFLFMMKHPDVQTRVQNEIDTVVGRQRLPNMADKAQMPYTQAVLQEILRMGNILLSNFGRLAAKDTVIGGYKIAKGTTVVPQLSVSNMDDDVFPNPATFNPDNFLEEDKITFKKVDEFVPFSVGKRSCLGEGLARMEMFLILTSILQKFRLTWPNDDVPINVEPVFGLSMVPHEYKCKVEIR